MVLPDEGIQPPRPRQVTICLGDQKQEECKERRDRQTLWANGCGNVG